MQVVLPKNAKETAIWERLLGVPSNRFMARLSELTQSGEIEEVMKQVTVEIAALPAPRTWAVGDRLRYIKDAHVGGFVFRQGLEATVTGTGGRWLYARTSTGMPDGVELAIPLDQAEDFVEFVEAP